MANTLTWTLLPNGIDRTTGRARLSLVAHPALDTGSGQLAGTPLENWPALVNGLGQLQVQVLEGGQVLAAERLGTAEVGSWATLFPPTTKVGEGPGDDGPFSELVGSFDYRAAHAEATHAYASALATNPTELLRADHPVARSLAGIAEAVDAGAVSAASGASATSGAGALAQAARFLLPRPSGAARESDGQGVVPVTPAPLSPVDPVEEADIHAALALIADHPVLVRHLGLVIDLTVPVSAALRGERTIRIATAAGGLPLQGPFAVVNRMWSKTRLDPDARLFTMVSRPGSRHRGRQRDARHVADLAEVSRRNDRRRFLPQGSSPPSGRGCAVPGRPARPGCRRVATWGSPSRRSGGWTAPSGMRWRRRRD
jgi:hypothetical protein